MAARSVNNKVIGTPKRATSNGFCLLSCCEVGVDALKTNKGIVRPRSKDLEPLVDSGDETPRRGVIIRTLTRVMSIVRRNNDDRPFVLKACSSDATKCCRLNVKRLSDKQLCLLVKHYEEQVTRVDEKMKSKRPPERLNIRKAAEEIFDKELVDVILNKVSFTDIKGIKNMDQDCFAIVVLQGLIFSPPFLDFVSRKTPETKLDHAVRTFVAQYLTNYDYINCSRIIKLVFPELGTQQEDAERFYEKFVDNYFDGALGKVKTFYTYICSSCGRVTKNTGSDNHLTVEWPEEHYYDSVTVTELIENTSIPNHMEDWKCDRCKKTGCGISTSYEFPDIFLVNLSPYYYTKVYNYGLGTSLERVARDAAVEFSSVQDFAPLVADKRRALYNLAAVIYYSGRTMNSGHYTARTFRDGQTYIADDSHARLESDGEIWRNNGMPYFAIYYKQSTEMKGNVHGQTPSGQNGTSHSKDAHSSN